MYRKINKYLILFAVMVLVSLTAGIASAAPVSQSISYQGKLTDAAGNPLTGTYSVTFKLYDVASGGTALATDTHSVTATSGLFTTTIATNPAVIDGRALWLGIKVGTDAEMTPRQEIRPVPYALGLRPWIVGASFTTNQAGSNMSGWYAGVNVSTLYKYNPGVRINTTGQTSYGIEISTSGDHSNGAEISTGNRNSDGVRVYTHGDSSIGVGADTFGDRSAGVYVMTFGDSSPGLNAWATGPNSPAVRGTSTYDVGVYGKGKEGGYFTTNSAGTSPYDLRPGVNVSTIYNRNPGVRITTSGDNSEGVVAQTYGANSDGVYARTSGDSSYGVHAWTQGDVSMGVYAVTQGDSSDGVHAWTYGFNSDGVYARTFGAGSDGVYAVTQGANSDGVYAQTTGTTSDGVHVETSGPGSYGVRARTTGTNSQGVQGSSLQDIGVGGYSDNYYGVYGHTTRSDQKYGIYTPDYLYAKGTQVPAADVAEYMPVAENVTPGTVLVIGDDGILQTSTTAYDTGIAGIVSTAPGVTLGTKEGGNPGEQIIAIAGRVPCKADTSNGPIHPRDLLTTSRNPGYAMKATNPQVGTVLGKAMGSLESGTGTIEVLVTLQ